LITKERDTLSIEDTVLAKLRGLPPEKQTKVLEFVESLKREAGSEKSLRSLEGLLEDLNIDITGDDIAQARREMWGNFPRELS
jgi:hypothetical protein